MLDFEYIWNESRLPVYTNVAGYDWKIQMYPRKKWWLFRDIKRFKHWKWGEEFGLASAEFGQGWNLFYGIIPWGYFHLGWTKTEMEIKYDRLRNIVSKKIVDEVRVIPSYVANDNGLPKGSLIGRYNKVKDGKRKFICWFLMVKKGVVNG